MLEELERLKKGKMAKHPGLLKLINLIEKAYDSPNVSYCNVKAFVEEKNGVIRVAIAGSDDCCDWWENTNVWKVKDPDFGWVHDGFVDCWRKLRPHLMEALERLDWKTKKVILCGHSQGAAMALYAAVWLASLGVAPTAVYTFGCPRAGALSWKRKYDSLKIKTVRVVNDSDPVTDVPKVWFFHVGELFPIGPKRTIWARLGLIGRSLSHRIGAYKASCS